MSKIIVECEINMEEMPICCYDCYISIFSISGLRCGVTGEIVERNIDVCNERSRFCPLKEVEEER